MLTSDAVVDHLRESGLKPTRQRIAIANILFKDGHKHVTAEDLFADVQKNGLQVSLATIYNTLHQFTDAGLLREVIVDGAKTYFDTNLHDHHHFYIEDTNEVFDMHGVDINANDIQSVPDDMEVVRVDVIVRLRKKAS